MNISEIFESKQGEGLLTGTPSLFVRTSGCNLRCWFCDTPYTSWQPDGRQVSIDDIIARAATTDCKHVVVTGGEPMIQAEVVTLTLRLRELGQHITIETAGTVDQPVVCDLMSISPKMANSTPDRDRAGEWSSRHEARRHTPDIVARLIERYDYQIKFVVAQPTDLDEIEDYVQRLPNVARNRVMLMPEGVQWEELERRGQWLEPICRERDFVFCPRMHIQWYGNRRGT